MASTAPKRSAAPVYATSGTGAASVCAAPIHVTSPHAGKAGARRRAILLRTIIFFMLGGLGWSFTAAAQSTKVHGRVTDSKTGEGLPFVSVFFKNTTVGISTDDKGYYTLESRTASDTLCAYQLGYQQLEHPVRAKAFNNIDFSLVMVDEELSAAKVKPNNKFSHWLLTMIDEHRSLNNPDDWPEYQCDIYNKMEFDLTNPEIPLKIKPLGKQLGFILDYMDTSAVTGQAYLPAILSETLSKRRHYDGRNSEVIEANRISGFQKGNPLEQLTGSMHLKTNFYEPYINAFDVQVPSPVQKGGEFFYNYYVVDSLMMDGRKTYKVHFHPKKFSNTPAFDGEMTIDAEEFALKDMHARLQKGENVNWIKALVIDTQNRRTEEGWVFDKDNVYVEFAISMKNTSRLISMIGQREMAFSNFSRTIDSPEEIKSGVEVTVLKGAGEKDAQWWDGMRPYELDNREQDIFNMVDSIQSLKVYKNAYYLANMLSQGYWEKGKIGIGKFYSFYSRNNLEG
ncbi:MAG: carboxypeptidase-like regulatory domain-containing protein, partial [Bacteroidales bacterium]|nr:carboxypeptidase-like regulatory domain-containing protein [Bacteroidales bacterium]